MCPYCAVGCGTHIYTKGGKVIDIEGNPQPHQRRDALSQGRQQLSAFRQSAPRHARPLPRPYSAYWERKPLEWALDRIAEKVKQTRDEGFTEKDDQGRLLNSVRNMGTLGGATLDNEENYLIKKLFSGGLGVVSIENQARI